MHEEACSKKKMFSLVHFLTSDFVDLISQLFIFLTLLASSTVEQLFSYIILTLKN